MELAEQRVSPCLGRALCGYLGTGATTTHACEEIPPCSEYHGGPTGPTTTTMVRKGPSPTQPSFMTKAELEARVSNLRKSHDECMPYTRGKLDFTDVNLRTTSGKRTLDEVYGVVSHAAQRYVASRDEKPLTMGRFAHLSCLDIVKVYIPRLVRSWKEQLLLKDANRSIHKIFSENGDANLEPTYSRQLLIANERRHWHAAIMRTFTLNMSGAITSNVLLQGVDSIIPSTQTYRSDRSTRFLERAKAHRLPTEEQVLKNVKADSTSTHPKLAAYRHLETVALTEIITDLDMVRHDPDISAAARDKMAYGERLVYQLKDLAHGGPSRPQGYDKLTEKLNGAPAKEVHTLIDDITYRKDLRDFAGDDIVVTTSLYESLSGRYEESAYRCYDVDEEGYALYQEVIGGHGTSNVFNKQLAWNFGNSDVVYIPNRKGSGFGVYDVVKHVRRDINKQTVFLCIKSWVNMPYELADRLNFETHGVRLNDFHTEPRPCKNVRIVGEFTKQPVLVMNTVLGRNHTVYTRYKNETSFEGTAAILPPVLRHLEYLYSNGGRANGLSSREILQRVQQFQACFMKDMLDRKVEATDYTSLLELFRVIGVPRELPCAVYYNTEKHPGEHPGETAPTEDRTAKAVQQAPSITTGTKTYGVLAPNDAALEKAADAHLGEGNTKERGPNMKKVAAFALREFVKAMEHHSGCRPGSVTIPSRDKVLENRTRASQRANETTWGLGECEDDDVGRAFCKANEVAAQKEAPRMIQSPAHEQSIKSGQLGMALDKIMKASAGHCHGVSWYCPGKNPRELGEALQEQYGICKDMNRKHGAGPIPQVDYKSADDSHTEETAEVIEAIINHFFSDDYDAELEMSSKAWALLTYKDCFFITVRVGSKIKVTGWKNASGTGITTLLNTLVFAYRSYMTALLALCFKHMYVDGEIKGMPKGSDGIGCPEAAGHADWFTKDMLYTFLKKEQNEGVLHEVVDQYHAVDWNLHIGVELKNSTQSTPVMRLIFELIGLKFGDDGVEYNLPGVSDYIWEAACWYLDATDGFRRTICFSDPGEDESVEFLSRVYPKLSETIASFCKIERAAEKLSISCNADDEKYRSKLFGYMITDHRTPVVGAYIAAIWAYKGFGNFPAEFDPQTNRFSVTDDYIRKVEAEDREIAWKLREGPFPVNDDDLDFMYECVAGDYGWSSGELRAFDASLRKQTTWDGIKDHKLPAALSHLIPDDPLGDNVERKVPDGVAMVKAFADEAALYNAMPPAAKERSRRALAALVGTDGQPGPSEMAPGTPEAN